MFGFQRVGDLIWAAADQRARGFLLGATAGRTTLSGEGLQHQDGSSHLIASTVPNCRAWDPAFASELAVIFDYGARRIMEEGQDEFHYVTVMNESYVQPELPAGVEADLLCGLYRFGVRGDGARAVRLVGSGAILPQAIAAADLLTNYGIASEIFSATSWSELARDAQAVERRNRLGGLAAAEVSHVQRMLPGPEPVIAATDYVRALPQMTAPYVEGRFVALGTDGFGRSSTRGKLRAFFEVDARSIAVAAIEALARSGQASGDLLSRALKDFGAARGSPGPGRRNE
jgi:pyruvate dehydrogenase E1 component